MSGRITLGSALKSTSDVTLLSRGTYIWSGNGGTWNGASAQLQSLSVDGSTWINVPGALLSADGQFTVDIGDDTKVKVLITGSPTGAGLTFSLARVQ